jgi:hypothetical protein
MIDLHPVWQTALTVAGAIGLVVLVGLVIAGEVGRAWLKKDPHSVPAARLVLAGILVRHAIRSRTVEVLAPPAVRALLVSLTDSDPPKADPDATPVTRDRVKL